MRLKAMATFLEVSKMKWGKGNMSRLIKEFCNDPGGPKNT
jgi:hypothetical protein